MTEEATTEAPQQDADPNVLDMEKYTATLEQNKSMLQQMEMMAGELEKFKQKHAEAEKHRKQQEREAQLKADEAARQAGDIQALESSWNDKYSSLEQTSTQTINELNNIINNVTVGAEAKSIASELAIEGSSGVLIPHIQSRLAMELVDGVPNIKVLVNGKPSALTIDDLKAEIRENKAFAPIVRGINASGTGNVGGSDKGSNVMNRANFEGLSHIEKSRFIKEGGKVVD